MNKDELDLMIDEYNEQMEGRIRVDEHGNRWRFHNGRWHGMCHIKPIKKRSDL